VCSTQRAAASGAYFLRSTARAFFDIGWPLCYLIAMKVAWEGKVYEMEKPLTVGQLLERFSLNPEAHIVVANEKLVTEDCKLSHEDNIRIIRVISGG
jgi:sulfur carrier protein ThiS